MNFFEDVPDSSLFVRHYDQGAGIVVTSLGQYHEPVILFQNKVYADALPVEPAALTKEHVQSLIDLHPEVILLGTGASQIFPAPQLLAPLYPLRIGIEVMTTDAACRTFNVLVSEGRAVLAVLF
jgi:uncharacterized protein